ncbi:SDR family NAD(P)-dependent oxidoreductase [Rubrobacter indicoceani]|uniref:SDR family NAD(P)-dependent oxidoreductase n=1 Tax=Rubrobacter indicoceani TaxID=2051957 RepID=UPI000E5C5316|nr:SDR family NAD(P)-dependent oxidoreductase [Rubrobacter indicoceani]
MRSFSNRVAAVTGAGSGIGRELALALARRGADLALSDVNGDSLAETVWMARATPRTFVTCTQVDVSVREEVYNWADDARCEHGRVNAVFNNAGVSLGSTVEGASDKELRWLFDINFWGVVYGTRAFLPHLRASGEGHVVNISSVFGLISVPGQGAYNASKAAVRGFTDALRMELEMGGAPVSATSVHPGGIKTNVARSARSNASLRDLGLDPGDAAAGLERLFITEPDRAAETILRAVERNRRRVLVGPDAHVIDAVQRLLPSACQHLIKNRVRRSMIRPATE